MKTPSSPVQREQQKKLKLWNFLSIPIDSAAFQYENLQTTPQGPKLVRAMGTTKQWFKKLCIIDSATKFFTQRNANTLEPKIIFAVVFVLFVDNPRRRKKVF
jgi:hypothetical protein